nr:MULTISPECIES: hypothetical protein [Cohnella]
MAREDVQKKWEERLPLSVPVEKKQQDGAKPIRWIVAGSIHG